MSITRAWCCGGGLYTPTKSSIKHAGTTFKAMVNAPDREEWKKKGERGGGGGCLRMFQYNSVKRAWKRKELKEWERQKERERETEREAERDRVNWKKETKREKSGHLFVPRSKSSAVEEQPILRRGEGTFGMIICASWNTAGVLLLDSTSPPLPSACQSTHGPQSIPAHSPGDPVWTTSWLDTHTVFVNQSLLCVCVCNK